MKLYVVYHVKGNRSPSDAVLETLTERLDHIVTIRPGIQGPVGPPQWKWTELNLDVLKGEIASRPPGLRLNEIVIYSVQQLVE